MPEKNMRIKISYVLLFTAVFGSFSIVSSQFDNGNIFVETWRAELSQHVGGTSEMGSLVPPEGLDIDQDGNKEFLLYDHVKESFTPFGRIQLWENTGNDEFKLEWEVEYCDWACQYEPGSGLAVADIDGDNLQEVLIAVESMLYIYECDGLSFESGGGLPLEPTASFYPLQDGNGEANIRVLRVKNMDADPDLEIFMGYSRNMGLHCVIGSLPGNDLAATDWKLEYADDFHSVDVQPGGGYRVGGCVIEDFDGDGKMEIFTSHWEGVAATRVYENDGIDTYVVKHTNVPETLILNPPFGGSYSNPIFHDFDEDGDAELLISGNHGLVFVITKEASNNFEDFGSSAWAYVMSWPTIPEGGFMRSGYMGDLDQDGKPDIYYNEYRAKAIFDLEYQGGPVTDANSWTPYEIIILPGVRFGNVQPAGDLDGDGLEELVCNMGGLRDGRNLIILESQHMASEVSQNKLEKSVGYILQQNYPNPFNSSTNIEYSIPTSSNVELTIFDLTGREIVTLVEENQKGGQHFVFWNGRDQFGSFVSTGLYTYNLKTDQFSKSRKLLFIK
jgi:hypothetical protein